MQDLFGNEPPEDKVPEKKKSSPKKEKSAEFPEPKNFETAVEELEELIRRLEGGEISLEESLEIYQKAGFLARWCYGELTRIRGKFQELGLDEDGNFELKELPPLD